MSFFQKIKEFFMGSSEPETPQPEYHPQHVATKNIKVQEFVDGRHEKLSANDVFPDMKVFEQVETPKKPSLEDIQSRLNNAKKSFPLPAGYKDACICMRMIIRNKQKEKKSYKNELTQLYRYACEHNFFDSEPYLEGISEPSYNLYEVIKKSEFSALEMPFEKIGYKQIPQLNKTDIKWLISEFGEPETHLTVSEYHNDFHKKAVTLLKNKREKEWEKREKEWQELLKI